MNSPYYEKGWRLGVGIVLLNIKKEIFMGERLDNKGAWQMPQGGVKIGKNEEPTIVSSTGETQTGAAAIEFRNRAFNNGFDVRIGLQSTLLDVISNADYMSNLLENLGDPFVMT